MRHWVNRPSGTRLLEARRLEVPVREMSGQETRLRGLQRPEVPEREAKLPVRSATSGGTGEFWKRCFEKRGSNEQRSFRK
jgi:hypothetical protein